MNENQIFLAGRRGGKTARMVAELLAEINARDQRVLQLEKMLADSQQQVWELQNGLRALIDGTLLDDAGNRGENGLRDWVRRSSTPETVVNHWLEVAVRTLVQGSK